MTTFTVTVAVPLALVEAASHVHMALGNAKDLSTYDFAPLRKRPDGAEYRVTSGLWTAEQIEGVQNPNAVDMPRLVQLFEGGTVLREKVLEAQAAFVSWTPDKSWPADKIVAFIGLSGSEAISHMGLDTEDTLDDPDSSL